VGGRSNVEDPVTALDELLRRPLMVIYESRVSLLSVLLFIGMMALAFLLSRYLRRLYDLRFARRFREESDRTIRRLIHYGVIGVGFLIALNAVGVRLPGVSLVAGGLGLGIGFGLRNLAANFISGLILLVERPIKVGDAVTVEDEFGLVESINLRATKVRTLDNITIIIPNSSFVEEKVRNWSHRADRVRLRCPVTAAYGTEPRRVMEILGEIAGDHADVLEQPPPEVFLVEFGPSAIHFELRFWVPHARNRPQTLHEINLEIERRFREASIEMPFPQRDVHLRGSPGGTSAGDAPGERRE